MNPTILEASDDLTNLSHLNEPAGIVPRDTLMELDLTHLRSAAGYSAEIFAEGNLHIQWYCSDSNQSLRQGRLPICTRYGTGLRWETESNTSPPSVRNCRGGICVSRLSYIRRLSADEM